MTMQEAAQQLKKAQASERRAATRHYNAHAQPDQPDAAAALLKRARAHTALIKAHERTQAAAEALRAAEDELYTGTPTPAQLAKHFNTELAHAEAIAENADA